jgi:hypothetical protein
MSLYAAMTVNERLFVQVVSWQGWTRHGTRRSRDAIARGLLRTVELTAEQAAFTTDTTQVNRG